MAKFAEVIECLKNGGTAQRIAWDVNGDKEIMMQIPQRIAKDIVPKMTSVQDIVKPKIGTVGSGEIEYHHQVIIIEFKDDEKTPARATYYIPTWEDIMADDWRMIQTADSYKARMKTEVIELEDKAEKLKQFFNSQIYNDLPKEERDLMMEQYDAMVLYSTKLRQRCELEGIVL
jgi:hypothetical protein